MGSRFSSPAAGDSRRLTSLIPLEQLGRPMSKEMLAGLGPEHAFTAEEVHAGCICWLTHRALKHFNANNPGAEFQYPPESTTKMKASCVGFMEHFIWYHICFSACRRDNAEMQLFFAELCYNIISPKITVETCVILEKPLCRFRNTCAFCPEESKIVHPSEPEFVCGKEGQQAEFFRMRNMLLRPFFHTSDGKVL